MAWDANISAQSVPHVDVIEAISLMGQLTALVSMLVSPSVYCQFCLLFGQKLAIICCLRSCNTLTESSWLSEYHNCKSTGI